MNHQSLSDFTVWEHAMALGTLFVIVLVPLVFVLLVVVLLRRFFA